MLFNSWSFLIFAVFTFTVFFSVKTKYRPAVILAASLFFYAYWNWKITVLLIITVWLNHRIALKIRQSRGLLVGGILLNLSFLIYFKYFIFFSQVILGVSGYMGISLNWSIPEILLPVGISFYTFQITGYIIDVYRGRITAEPSFARLLLFTVYFPQLVAGPVERAEKLLPALSFTDSSDDASPHRKTKDLPLPGRIASGLYLFLTGLFKKLFIADNLAPFTDLHLVPGIAAPSYGYTAAAVVFAIQIYADFSGYTDMARGLGRILGTELSENFRLPFFASNPAELWRRWHITLMSFLRDYVYFPLGGGRAGKLREFINIMIVFFIGGLWHGASIGHIVWGLWSGLLVVMYRFTKPLLKYAESLQPQTGVTGNILRKTFSSVFLYGGIIYTFLTFSWGALLIRIPSLEQFVHIYTNLFPSAGHSLIPPLWPYLAFYISPVIITDYLFLREEKGNPVSRRVKVIFSFVMILLIIFFGYRGSREFIYFQF